MKPTAFLLGLALALGTVPAFAQDAGGLTAEELSEIFNKQKTRGLVIAPGTDVGTPAVVPDRVDTAPQPPAATYVALDKSEQVNILIQFDFDSAALREDQKPKLVALCQAMRAVDVQLFRIVGHTDASGSASYNMRLSQLRAEEVKRHLVNDCGIPATRLEAVGVGKDYLFDPQNPRADQNRRVEFQAIG